MADSQPHFIGKRIVVKRNHREIIIEISQRVKRWQETLMLLWLIAWTFCGIVFLYHAFAGNNRSEQIFFIICSSVFLFFFVRIGKVFLWRIKGREIISISNGKIQLQNAFGSRGKKEIFLFENIFKLGIIKRDPTSFLGFLDESFWVIGGERVGFSYAGQKIRLGKQLSPKDSELLIRVLESGLRELKDRKE
jgi:hypothetical protein